MATNARVSGREIYDHMEICRKKLDQMDGIVDKLYVKLNEMATGENNVPLWAGATAETWYESAYKQVGKSYGRIANMSLNMRAVCKYAKRTLEDDKAKALARGKKKTPARDQIISDLGTLMKLFEQQYSLDEGKAHKIISG